MSIQAKKKNKLQVNWGSLKVAVVMETIDVDFVDSFLFLFLQ